jgi:diguanylate cyclase (GGDEF)-like protein
MADALRSAPVHEPPLDAATVAAAARKAAAAVAAEPDHARAIAAATTTLWQALPGSYVSAFVLEHGRFWLVAQSGCSVVPDGIGVESGVVGRAVRLGEPQVVAAVREDPDYIEVLPGFVSEVALPLRAAGSVVGALNLESERVFPPSTPKLLEPVVAALAPRAEALAVGRVLDVAALARLFVYLGSLRDADEIARLAAAALAKVLPIEASQVVLWDEEDRPAVRASWRAADGRAPLTTAEIEGARSLVDPSIICQILGGGRRGRVGSVVWLPLRANGEDLGALVGLASTELEVDEGQLDTAALLAAHVAATLEAAVVLRRVRQSAETDPLTGILNRRGFEERLDAALAEMAERRVPLSLLIIDCDDFKEINDRAGHEFGDALLVEMAERLERLLPPRAAAARLGGDEFVVMLPEAGADGAAAVGGRLREALAEGMTDAGFPLTISAGISTFPFDGDSATALIRAADQALYAAKNRGKNRIASFRDVLTSTTAPTLSTLPRAGRDRRSGAVRGDGSVLAEALEATRAIAAETTAEAVCGRLCKSLVFVVGATGCLASRIEGEYLVDASGHALRDVSLGPHAAYRISDFPLTEEVLRTGEPRAMSLVDADVDPAEAFILRELSMNALLMLPLRVGGEPWGLVEVYEMRLRRFTDDDVALARFLVESAERRLAELGPDARSTSLPPLYELPPDTRVPRTR